MTIIWFKTNIPPDKSTMGSIIHTLHSWIAETSRNLAFNGLLHIYWKQPKTGASSCCQKIFSGVLCLCYGSPSSSKGTTYWGVVCFHRYDRLLGLSCINGTTFCLMFLRVQTFNISFSGDVLGARYRKVPCDPLVDDGVWILCALVFLLLHSSPGFCS